MTTTLPPITDFTGSGVTQYNFKQALTSLHQVVGESQAGLSLMQQIVAGGTRVINGGMTIDQRNYGAAQVGVNTGQYICDRFPFYTSQAGKWTLQQVAITDLPGAINAGKVTISTPYTTGPTDTAFVDHKIEGINVFNLAWGTPSASPVTISFSVKSSVTGVYAVTILNKYQTRVYSATYTVSTAGLWTTVTLTIPGDTNAAWIPELGTDLILRFGLGCGSNYAIGAANTWGTTIGYQPAGGAVISGVLGGYWQMTGLKLEPGSSATPFGFEPTGMTLALCQRYCQAVGANHYGRTESTTAYGICVPFSVEMRVNPSVSVMAGRSFNTRYNNSDVSIVSPTISATTTSKYGLFTQVTSTALTANIPVFGRHQNGLAGNFLLCSAEL